ncbi:GPI ethanolamine phosphate transferase 2 [Quillaja saponaria]|uniref:GPI ethanolamine phosphate transferase 2 n=1 Tax=Quillaja saponaria TaxID=32244 RepID=A0AAD7L8V3_QUISA|nr:GPI ethanolamine phosphate transferase 2 [Quillaja saponaria]
MSSLTCTKLTLLAIAAVLIQSIGLSLFVFGFFPVKPTLSGYSGPESFRKPTCNGIQNQSDGVMSPNQLRLLYQEISGIRPSFDRLVLMVIDGLPAEFVLGKNGQPPSRVFMEAMPYTQSLLANGMAIGYHAKAAPPTVTMPRLKAMVSGAIGGFLDVAFNFNTQAFLDDNLLGQFFKIGWKMVMLGDDTWLRLFPGLFMRQDGVSSFFVKDTVQVDQNVSRHLADELSRDDWNLLILHYLGLDHVGHIGGRNSVLMAPKLSEMDEVVKMIHMGIIHNLENDQGRTLLVVVSDHGMTENGNHGGSSYEETDSLALFIGLRGHVTDHSLSNSNIISQVDIAPTIALLFGVPIPKNNVGLLISEAFDSWTDDQKLRALELNSWQLFRLLQAQLPGLPSGDFACDAFSGDRGSTISGCNGKKEQMFCCLYLKASTLHNAWKSRAVSRSYSSQSYSDITARYHEFLKTASEWLLHRATDKPVDLLAFGVTAMIMSSLNKFPTAELKYSLYVIGWGYIFSWCLLQLLLQQPINSVPLLLLLVQILASILTFAVSGQHHNWLVEVAALYYLGMTGHFALGNSNTLATIDVAGAFIGISTHSTLLSGMLMFIITYASPMLFLLSMVMYISVKSTNYPPLAKTSDSGIFLKNMLGFPCLVPLSVNSVLLTTYTIVLLLMRNHLFVWSVFSPKYLYVYAATVCVYAGVTVVAATVFYTYVVLAIRKNMKNSLSNAK